MRMLFCVFVFFFLILFSIPLLCVPHEKVSIPITLLPIYISGGLLCVVATNNLIYFCYVSTALYLIYFLYDFFYHYFLMYFLDTYLFISYLSLYFISRRARW